jgi:hypothetical protein
MSLVVMIKNELRAWNLYAGWEKPEKQQSIVMIKSFTEAQSVDRQSLLNI